MFSYLRPHRRTPSNPASPQPDPIQTWENPLAAESIAEHQHRQQHQNSPNSVRPSYVKRYTSPTTPTAPLGTTITSSPSLPSDSLRIYRTDDTSTGQKDMKSQWLDAQIEQRMHNISLSPEPRHTEQNGRPISEGTGSKAVKSAGLTVDTSFAGGDYQNARTAAKRPTSTRFQTSPPATTVPTPLLLPSEPAPSRSTKARRTLLKPMSLLARRRTSHQTGASSPVLSSPKLDLNPIAANDLSIRGTVVHDFSAPRPRRNVSYTDMVALPIKAKESPFQHSPANGEPGSWSHTPAFTEDFDEQQYPAAGPHVRRASDLTDLHSPIPQYAKEARSSPENARRSSQSPEDARGELIKPSSSPGPPVPPKPGTSSENLAHPLSDSIQATPDTTPEKHGNRSRNVSAASITGSVFLGIPRHQSTSSRFSFDIGGAASQEKLLEDGYRKREAEKRFTGPGNKEGHVQYDNEGEDDEFDYDAMMDDDGLEERIPGINADLYDDDGEEGVPLQNNSGFTFHPMTASTMTPSPNSLRPSIPAETPRNSKGDVIGFALSKDSPDKLVQVDSNTADSPMSPASREMLAKFEATFDGPVGLGLNGIDVDDSDDDYDDFGPALKPQSESRHGLIPAASFPHPGDLDDDDLYFDDGIIAQDDDEIMASTFDESLFDRDDTDQYGRPYKNLPPLQTNNLIKAPNPALVEEQQPAPAPEGQEKISEGVKDESEEINEEIKESNPGGLAPQPSLCYPQRPSLGLTQDTLAAYQDALALAAQEAFAKGKFSRSVPDVPEDAVFSADDYEYDDSQDFQDLQDDFDYDDNLSDDPIIAAANAEALANDPDGFYGQEFGFYSAPLPSNNAAAEAEYAMGGYFGPRGVDGLTRSQSGRVPYGFREPNLTPITERSEYSARNSVMSNFALGAGARDSGGATPGLAQLQLSGLMSPLDDDDLSLSRLMKARRGAWGGSQASAGSDTGNNSPSAAQGHARNDSALSGSAFSEREEEVSPRVSLRAAALGNINGGGNGQTQGHVGHMRVGSSESVSYVRDEERWVLERRRTGEDGVEVLGREVVVGGRI